MPYLNPKLRDEIEQMAELNNLVEYLSRFSLSLFLGALNYIIFKIVRGWIKEWGITYQYGAAIIGTIDCAKEEIRRRILNPYEDEKISENGDVL